MRRLVILVTILSLTTPLISGELDDTRTDTESLYQTGSGAEAGSFTAISKSMVGWGFFLAAAIVTTAILVHQSRAD